MSVGFVKESVTWLCAVTGSGCLNQNHQESMIYIVADSLKS